MIYRDSTIILFRDKVTGHTCCRLCLRPRGMIPCNVPYCSGWECVCSITKKTIRRPFFDNTKHKILLSLDKCFLCDICSYNNEPSMCNKNVYPIIEKTVDIIKTSERMT